MINSALGSSKLFVQYSADQTERTQDINSISLREDNEEFISPILAIADFGVNQGWTNFGTYPRVVADVNGDGKADIIGFGGYGVVLSLSTGTSFASPILALANFGVNQSWFRYDSNPRTVADVNGDGKADILGFADPGVFLSLSTGTSFSSPILVLADFGVNQGWTDYNFYPRVAVDVNDDGKADIIGFGGYGVVLSLSMGTSFGSLIPIIADFGMDQGWANYDLNPRTVADINEDGIADIVGFGNNGVYISSMLTSAQNYAMASKAKFFVPMNKSDDSGLITIDPIGTWCNSESLYMGDFNGDGKIDLLCNLGKGKNYIMLSYTTLYDDAHFVSMNSTDKSGRMSIGHNYNWCSTSFQELFIGDFNGDKKSDLLCSNNANIDQGRTYVMLSNGKGFYPISSSSDGKVDVGINKVFCPIPGRLIVGNFDGIYGDDLFCNHPILGNMLMVSNYNSTSKSTVFKSINEKALGDVIMGNDQECEVVWCGNSTAKLLSGYFNGDNKTDLLCNLKGGNMIMLSAINSTSNCDFTAVQYGSSSPELSGNIKIPTTDNPDIGLSWCDASSQLRVGDINGDGLTDLVCNNQGQNKIMFCEFKDSYTTFVSIDAAEPEGDGSVDIANHHKWCLSQNLFMDDFSGDSLADLWCNQYGEVVGEYYYSIA